MKDLSNYRLISVKSFWECCACNGMFGETRHDRRNPKRCGIQHKSEESAKKHCSKLPRFKQRRWQPSEIQRFLYKKEK